MLYVFVWIIFRRWYFLISLVIIVLGYRHVDNAFGFSFRKPEVASSSSIKVMSYNVRIFVRSTKEWIAGYDDSMVKFINKENPDIICLQEFGVRPDGLAERYKPKEKDIIDKFPKYNWVSACYTLESYKYLKYGLVTMSRFPVIQKFEYKDGDGQVYCLVTDLRANRRTIRVINVHLASTRLEKHGKEFLNRMFELEQDERFKESKNIVSRLTKAFQRRAIEIDKIAKIIKTSKYPVLLCGDFNDTPQSYAYGQIIGSGLNDSFDKFGVGFGATYNGEYPAYRIDYIMYDPRFINATSYSRPKVMYSDHYPILSVIDLK